MSDSPPRPPSARSWRPALGAVLLVVMAGTAGGNAGDRSAMGVALLLAGVAALPVLLPAPRAGRSPAPGLLLNGGAVGAYLTLGLAPGPIFLTLALSTLVVALDRPPRTWAPWSAAALALVAGGAVAGVLRDVAAPGPTGWQWVAMAALTAGAGAVATAVRTRADARGHRAERAAAEERLRMAQDLHDGVGHGLAVIAMQAGVALHVLDRDPAAAAASLLAIRDTSRESLDRLRGELARLSDVGDPSPRTPEPGLEGVAATLERVRAGGLVVDLDVSADGSVVASPTDLAVDAAVGTVAHRVVQEALTNVLRHADARRVRVSLAATGPDLAVAVVDDGRGPVDQAVEGLGLRGIRARVEAVGGSTETGAGDAGGGFRVAVRVPRTAAEVAR